MLATQLDIPLTVVAHGDSGVKATRQAVLDAEGPVLVVLLRQDAGDSLLLGLLTDLEQALAGSLPWDKVPQFTLLTARDLPALSWVAAKACLSLEPAERKRLVHLLPDKHHCASRELELSVSTGPVVAQRTVDGVAVPSTLLQYAQAVAVQTHGSDACARGGDGAVLCGLHGHGAASRLDRPGALACGQGLPCPRGPRPTPLSQSQADLLMVTSCNGLRLLDSNTQPDFNLGLAFLEGSGRAYVASVTSGMGTDATTAAFLAALASGRTLAEATMILNAFITCAGVDQPTYIAVGHPDHCVSAPHTSDGDLPCWLSPGVEETGRDITIFGNDRHFVEFRIDNPAMLDMLENGRLGLAVDPAVPAPNPSRFWFARAEGSQNDGRRSARGFAYSFPHPLGELTLHGRDVDEAVYALDGALTRSTRWRDLWAQCQEGASAVPDLIGAVDDIVAESRAEALRMLPSLRYDIDAWPIIDTLVSRIHDAGSTIRRALMDDLLPQLAGSFYLTNVLIGEYAYAGATGCACLYCGRLASRKRFTHPLRHEVRFVEICPRCGIVTDRPHDPALAISIEAPELVARGDTIDAEVCTAGGHVGDGLVGVRLSTHGLTDLPPTPELAVLADTTTTTTAFSIPVSQALPPHEYSLKALAADDTGLAFAHKLIWVR
ncbi:hypothetical protein EV652_12175 [Kribbella steppae]|uniref:Uncharacterized protein n=1 Tax=Kribbella steppae TaxID=2512223 RepID=A0A4R2GWY8_9ACTN|nr:hypothetical protein EV652_12175 [Kribbella steppae]